MNFLAHIYLSGENKQIQLGNFLADMVKPKDRELYSKDFQKGIELHLAIDEFTDHHEMVRESKKLIWDKYRHYSAVLVDIFYDHFLALQWNAHSEIPMRTFVDDFYRLMHDEYPNLPEGGQRLLPFMEAQDWLYNYQYPSGIHRVLQGMSRRASFKSKMEGGVEDLKLHFEDFQSHFNIFFPELKNHVASIIETREF